MNHLFLRGVLAGAAGSLALLVGCERLVAPPEEPPASEAERARLSVINLADDFTAFYDATAGLPTAERVAAFKRDIAPLFPEYYGLERFAGKVTPEEYDARIAGEIEDFAEIRDAYIAKVSEFGGALDENVASFLKTFPDFETNAEIHLLHSLGEMDGGTREFNTKLHLIFGADGMVRYHKWENETPFFHHELFHLHHSRSFVECEEVWCSLWAEGLAVYVSQQMNPQATPAELLLEFPPGMMAATEEKLGPALAQLKGVLSSTESDDYAGLFTTQPDGTGLPGRRGYVLGLLLARELAESRDLETLARMPNDEMKPLLFEAVDRLAEEAGG